MIKIFYALLLTFVFANASLYAQEVTSTINSTPENIKPFIKIDNVAFKAVDVQKELLIISEKIRESKRIVEIHDVIPSYLASIEALLQNPIYEALEKQNVNVVRKEITSWDVYLKELKTWAADLDARVAVYNKNSKILNAYSKLWTQTHINADQNEAPQVIEDHIANVIIEIELLRNKLKVQYDTLLTDANYVINSISKIDQSVIKLRNTEDFFETQIFYKNGLPLFTALQEHQFTPVDYITNIVKAFQEKYDIFRIYHNSNQDIVVKLIIACLAVLIFVFYFYYLHRINRLFVQESSKSDKNYIFITRPIATALIITELLFFFIYDNPPKIVFQLELLVLLLAVFRILQAVVPSSLYSSLYIYGFLYFLAYVETFTFGFSLENRILNLAINATLFILLYKLYKNRVFGFVKHEVMRNFIYKILPLFLLLSFVAFVTNIYGMVLLSHRISEGLFRTLYAGILFYTLSIILVGYVVINLRRRVATASYLLEKYSQKLENIISTLIKIWLFLWWIIVVLKIFSIYEPMMNLKDKVLEYSWLIGKTTVSVNAIVDFITIAIGTWVLVTFLQMILKVEIFARYKLPRGFPTAISTVLNYIIVISGTIIAFSSLGITSAQFSIIFGALGVGFGFGLRNIIANFVSGIIMVFERPIQIGDTIEVDKTIGTVQKIGTRASSIKTFDGSEVIIPNADFISTQVINWTLSDERRRKELLFKVDYDSDIEKVLSIMSSIAIQHPDVLTDPDAPLATFTGFGEYYLEFKLYFWLSDNLIVAQSDVAIGIYKKLKEEGIKMPLPKHKLIKEA